ncbi:hypothetical protein N658DRAFT_485165 [Parathielavia hyrcaniae]|uniref:Amidohydrolase-related domain-containing protein n=1 Tax=Parathielavia hyrcaniae TaxID=113614 RepID=A0AAN6Q734_9PEZI|nr:hypothetical protein N658DRAFT_485165 [Parathielavia hyrcaniae]
MSFQSNVGNSQVYEDGDQRNPKASEMGSGTRYHEGTAHAHKSNDTSMPELFRHKALPHRTLGDRIANMPSEDQRSLANRANAEKSSEAEAESQETSLHKKDPTLPAKMHGNKPSRGADIDAELQAEDEAMLGKKGGQNMPGKKMAGDTRNSTRIQKMNSTDRPEDAVKATTLTTFQCPCDLDHNPSSTLSSAEEPTMPPASDTLAVHTSLLFDPIQKAFLENVSILVNTRTGAIVRLDHRNAPDLTSATSKRDIDLRGKVVLPGLVDSHTHIFLHSDKERFHSQQMRDQSPIERTVRATNHARAALLAGYTTYRDLGTEALGSADASFRDCVNRGLTPGPRLFVATEAIASSGGYEIRTENRYARDSPALGLSLPRAADPADGVEGVRAAVRRRVGEGADVIKFYGDYRRRVMRFPPDVPGPGGSVLFPPDKRGRNPAVPLFSQDEMAAIVREARLADVPVAAHAGEAKTAVMAAMAGVTSVEHVFEDPDGVMDWLLQELVRNKTIWVPTLATGEFYYAGEERFERSKVAIKRAFDHGVRVAAGGDTGVFNHGLNAREMEIMMEAGVAVEDVLVAGTYNGWHACGGDACGYRFGWWDEGNRADIVALDADPRKDPKALRRVSFVMKDGQVWKRDGLPVGMIPVPKWPVEEEDGSKEYEHKLRVKASEPKVSAPGSSETSTNSTSSTPPLGSTPPSWVVRLSGNPTPAGSDIGWETESFDV